MSKFRKLAAILLSAALVVCILCIPAGAASIADTAKSISSGKTNTVKLYKNGETADYKIKVTKSGDLKLKINTQMQTLDVYLYDTNGNCIHALDLNADAGTTNRWGDYVYCTWNSTMEKYSGSFK